MNDTILYVVVALGISIVINIFLKKVGISQIIGYIMTGTVIVYLFDLRHLNGSHTLEVIGEFGIVLLMFTIGLEMSLAKMGELKKEIFFNGFMQVLITALFIYGIAHYIFGICTQTSIIVSLAFSLSSTAVVLSYLKNTKEIYTPYGQRATGILIFQDIAVIPILILIGFLTMEGDESVWVIVWDTFVSAVVVLLFLTVIGKKIMTWLLHFSASSEVDELFMGSVLFIVIGASMFAHSMGFTYSLGAFVAGMMISETKYLHKVEADIAPFKDLLLGTFFIVVGMKIDLEVLFLNVDVIIAIFFGLVVLKSITIYLLLRLTSYKSVSFKSAIALSQVGEFSFVIFALATSGGLLADDLSKMLVLVVIFSMIVTPFYIGKIGKIAAWLYERDPDATDFKEVGKRKNHVIVCGYGTVGKFVVEDLQKIDAPFIVVDNSQKHVQRALDRGIEAYLGDMSKKSVLDSLHIENSASVIITLDNVEKKILICEAILQYKKDINLIVKVVSLEEKNILKKMGVNVIVDGKIEVANVIVNRMLSCDIDRTVF